MPRCPKFERRLAEQDALAVELEPEKYRAAGVISGEEELADFDILLILYWQSQKHIFPLLYRVALDVLPAQASSVPCERVFSSGKETDAGRRSKLSPENFEKLQVLKFVFRNERLSFENDWCETEEAMLSAEHEADLGSSE